MSGHSPDAQQLRDILWRDSTLESISANYDSISIRLLESTGRTRTINCGGYIGYRAIAIWDEMLVLDGVVLREDEFLTDCTTAVESKVGYRAVDTGSPARNRRDWKLLRIRLEDGACIDVVAAVFKTDPGGS